MKHARCEEVMLVGARDGSALCVRMTLAAFAAVAEAKMRDRREELRVRWAPATRNVPVEQLCFALSTREFNQAETETGGWRGPEARLRQPRQIAIALR